MIESLDPITLPLYAVALYAAAMYPLGIIFGSTCSLCCCQKCTGCNCCGTDYARPTGFCCEGQWRLPGTGSCCGGEFRTTEEEAGGQCCDDVWYTNGTCCKVPTVPLYFTSDFGGVETCNALARGKIILTNGRTTLTAVLQHGGSGYARVVDEVIEVASVSIISLNNLEGTYATLSATIDDDPDSETFGQITALTIDDPGGGYDQWYAPPQDHYFPDSEEGECCGNDWDTGEGTCCKNTWYPAANPCDGTVFVSKSANCCGCFSETVYDPETQQMVPTLDNLELVECLDCGPSSVLYSRFDPSGVDQGPIGRCCAPNGECTYTFEDDCDGVWEEEKCCSAAPRCAGPCCFEDSNGVVTCGVVPTNECQPPNVLGGEQDCESSCKGACCIDGAPIIEGDQITMMTQAECDEVDGCWAGIGRESCRDTDECRPPFTPNCCETVVSDASGLTFTQPRRKRCAQAVRPWVVTVTGTTDSEIMIHGVPVGQTATPTKRCPINVAFLLCWDKFNIEPMPCNDSFRRLDVTVCWTPADASPIYQELMNYSGCNDITLWLGDCTRDCATTLTYAGPSVTVGPVQIIGSATIQSNGGAMTIPAFTIAAACNITLTLDGTSEASNSVPAMANPTASTTLSIDKIGSGRWTLTAASTFTGATQILGGTLVVAANAPADGNGAFGYSLNGGVGTGSSPIVTLAGGAALLLDQGAQVGRIVAITGGSGAATAGGANTSGTTRFQSTMTFFVNQNVLLQAATGGTVEFANGWLGGAYGAAGGVDADFTVGSTGNTGKVMLSGNLSTTGAARVEYGTLKVTGTIAADGGVTIDGSGAELDYRSGADLASPVALVSGTLTGEGTINSVSVSNSPTIRVDGGDTITIDEALSGDGSLSKTGGGTLRVTCGSTFSGTIDVSAGTLHITGSSGQLQLASEVIVSNAAAELLYDSSIGLERPLSLTAGTLAGNGTISDVAVSNSSTIRVDGGNEIVITSELSGSGTLTKSGDGVLRITGDNTFSGSITISGGTLATAATVASMIVENSTGLDVDFGDEFTITTTLGGSGTLSKTGGGTLTITATNTFPGILNLTQGVLAGNAILSRLSVSNSPTVTVASGDEIEIGSTLSGTGALLKDGEGTLTLSCSNTFAGTLDITDGFVVVQQLKENPGDLATAATLTNTTMTVAFSSDPASGDEYVLLAGPTTQTYAPNLTGTTKTATYNASTSTLTID